MTMLEHKPPVAGPEAPATSFIRAFFDTGLRAIFTHTGQLMNASLVVAAGTYALHRGGDLKLPGVFDPLVAGYVLTGAGVLLLVLNFFQGLYQVMKLKHGWGWSLLLILFYVFVSIRAAQFLVAFRNGA
jgi:hypothetical protein